MALTYKNRLGDRYYLHGMPTKKGKTRYVMARTIGEGALDALPEGIEIRESVNGQVSVGKAVPRTIPPAEEQVVLDALRSVPRLAFHTASVEGDSIVVHEPHGGDGMTEVFARMGLPPRPPKRFAPVLRFDLEDLDSRRFTVRRMTYRGDGGWSWPLESGKLAALAKKVIPKLGTDDFFELM